MHYYFGEGEALWEKGGYPGYKTDNGPFSYIVRSVGGFSIRGPPGLRFQRSVKRLEDERMKEKYTDSVQNRFTAYLVAAVTNKRIHYMKYKKRLQEQEFLQVDLQEKHYLDFDRQYHDYIGEQTEFIMEDWERFQDLLILLESEKLILRDEEGIDERDIYVEKESGRQFERPVYRSLVDNILREGDLLVVTEGILIGSA